MKKNTIGSSRLRLRRFSYLYTKQQQATYGY